MKGIRKLGRTFVVLAGVMLLVAGNVSAQPGPGGVGQPPSASEMVSKMKQSLNLTDEQVSQITTIMQEEMSQMESLMKSGNPESGRSQMESIHQQTESKLAQILTADQLSQWKSSRPQGGPGNGGGRPSGGRGGPGSDSSSSGSGSTSSSSTSGSGVW